MPITSRKFELTKDHVMLAASVNFKPCAYWEDGLPGSLEFYPEISAKRPFGNSGVTYDVAQRLGLLEKDPAEADDPDGSLVMTPAAERRAMKVLIEMPVALEAILVHRTFQPGIYDVDRFSAYFMYREYMQAWFWLDAVKACADIKDPDGHDLMERAFCFCRSGSSGWNPYAVLGRMRDWARGTSPGSPAEAMYHVFRDSAIDRFRRLHPRENLDDEAAVVLLIAEGDPSDSEWPFWDERDEDNAKE